jgi:DNA mismatch repair protein MutL
MNIIQKLSQKEAQKIAAGEVVERPSNVLKELIENSLDAGATTINISVKQGGKERITITDNGSGMSLADAKICFKRHTTSKIKTVEQLDVIKTFGFRGEALASICSVSKITITTKKKRSSRSAEDDGVKEGIKLHLEAGTLTKETIIGCPSGTTFDIYDLFYNVPARKKFLKATATEWNHIVTLFKASVLSHPNVHFILEHNNKAVYNCPSAENTKERVLQVFEPPLTKSIISLTSFESDGVAFSGAITTQHYARYDRGGIFFFVNNRWVHNFKLTNALVKGYSNVLPTGRYPAAVICISIDQKTIDINIHPKKEEIKFMNQRYVESALTAAIKATLENHLSKQLKKHVTLAQKIPTFDNNPFQNIPTTGPSQFKYIESAPMQIDSMPLPPNPIAIPKPPLTKDPIKNNMVPVEQINIPEQYALIGQFKKTYLLLEHKEGLFVIDQHAAHERILYEKFEKRFKDVAVVPLLFPLMITISEEDMSLLAPHLFLFKDHGIEIEPFGHTQLAVKATPVFLKNQPFEDVIQQTVGWIKEFQGVDSKDFFKKITERIRAQMACKAAVRAGDFLSNETMEQLLSDLESTENRFSCPHGRPTSWLLETKEIEKKFKRDYK